MAGCGHIKPDPSEVWGAWRCDLTGNSVDADCADLTAGLCIPRQALRLRAGTLETDYRPHERQVLMDIGKQLQTGGGSGDIELLDEPALAAVEQRIRDRRKALKASRAALPRLNRYAERMRQKRAKLRRDLEALETEIALAEAQINTIEESGAVAAAPQSRDVKGRKLGGAAVCGRGWSPERRAKQAETMRRMRAATKAAATA